MKKILILIVGIALYLHFYPNPEINKWYEEKKAEFLDTMAKSTKVTFKSNLDGVYEELKAEFIGFSPEELQNLKVITSSLESITEFYQQSCTGTKQSKLFHPDNADKVCAKISTLISKM
ncbi:hypothetical protein [Thalassotalea agariperforans]|mgnify:CR=1 FL=1